MKIVQNIGNQLARIYIGTLTNWFYFKDVEYVGNERIPSQGTPMLIVCDSKDRINDALGVFLSSGNLNPVFLPKADDNRVEDVLDDNGATVVFAGKESISHSVFKAAQEAGFRKDILILPVSCRTENGDMPRGWQIIRYGEPISLSQWYVAYKGDEDETESQVDSIVRQELEKLHRENAAQSHEEVVQKSIGPFQRILLLVLTLPFAIFGLWPSLACWSIPRWIRSKYHKTLPEGSILLIANLLLVFPIAGLITMVVAWPMLGFFRALAWVLLLPAICCAEWAWFRLMRKMP